MTLIGRGDKPRDRYHSADYHTNLSTGNVVKCRPAVRKMLAMTPEYVFFCKFTVFSISKCLYAVQLIWFVNKRTVAYAW